MKTKELSLNKAKYNEDLIYLKKYIKEYNLTASDYQKYLEKLPTSLPIQYLIGNVNFYGYQIKVNESVLIPRFETELLVEKTINKINRYFPSKKIDIIDLGTGSGCIAITLKKELNSNVYALDISLEALNIAKDNAKLNNAEITFINDDMDTYKEKKFDVIISNPPYINPDEEIMPLVKDNEPGIALYAKDKGLYHYEQIIKNLKYLTKENYLLAFEIGYNQAESIKNIANKYLTNINISLEKDYQDKERFIFITNIK